MESNVSDDVDFVECVLHLLDEYVTENPHMIADPDFHAVLEEAIKEMVYVIVLPIVQSGEDAFLELFSLHDDWQDLIDDAIEIFFETLYPRRSWPWTSAPASLSTEEKDRFSKQIELLRAKPQPTQRTPEWYALRHRLITASNAFKAFESQSQQNQLIYEKCQPLVTKSEEDEEKPVFNHVNVNSPFHWGQKYEPLAAALYEDMFETRLEDFGCIQHDTWSFLGASPDGINVDPASPRYGRLLEIKNIVNREIDGIPKKEYWVQMQLQMETCGLDDCDFLECRFVEYKGTEYVSPEKEFLADGDPDVLRFTADGSMKGVIMHFTKPDGAPFYEYMPFSVDTLAKYVDWESNLMASKSDSMTWIGNLFWRLEEFSCVLVERNRRWFEDNVSVLSALWDIIVVERESGYEHRAPIRRIAKRSDSIGSESGGVLLQSWYKKNIT